MKNALFTTTALVAFAVAGSAAADISLTGSAEIGLTYNDSRADQEVTLVNDFDLSWSLSGTTDNGLTFGANGDWDEVGNDQAPEVFISGAFGTLTAGDTDGAFDKAMIEAASGGIDDEADFYMYGNQAFDGVSDGDSAVLRYDSPTIAGGVVISLSWENGEPASGSTALNEEAVAIGVNYSGGTFSVGAGYQTDSDAGDAYGLSTQISLGAATVNVSYANLDDGVGDADIVSASVTFAFGTSTLGLNYSETDNDGFTFSDIGTADATGYGVWYTYDLGGGAEFVAAVGTQEIGSVDTTRAGFGISMSF